MQCGQRSERGTAYAIGHGAQGSGLAIQVTRLRTRGSGLTARGSQLRAHGSGLGTQGSGLAAGGTNVRSKIHASFNTLLTREHLNMLQIKDICKEYRTDNLVQKALDHVSLNLRDSEFVAVLGPSGSGKTTLLNIIGGLDRYDSGDLIINEISTKNYEDRDWDSYRNHTIGFVFQSYNLIPHQSILANVELALTISGIPKEERRQRAVDALKAVGLDGQFHKKPSQLSGGQMQRVAIARALVNNPDILLADEPTGALDSETSIQVMDLLKEVAKDRLVVMVTHNPELAEQYATRIVNLKDGHITSDSNPYIIDDAKAAPTHKNMGKTFMSFLTSLSLSFNNLKTKKGRTLLTAFAGSIGIIGIALILSLANGVNSYIEDIEEQTLSEYPLQIQSSAFDMTAMMNPKTSEKKKQGDVQVGNVLTSMFSTVGTNDLKSLKSYIDSNEDKISPYTRAIEYSYAVSPQIYRDDPEEIRQVHPDQSFKSMGFGSDQSTNSMMSTMMSTDIFYKLPENESLYRNQYEIKAGHWPKNKNECVLVLSPSGQISDFMLYALGKRDFDELDKMVEQFTKEEKVVVPEIHDSFDFDELLGTKFKMVSATDYYEYDPAYDIWKDKRDNTKYMKNLVESGEELKIAGIVQLKKEAKASVLFPGIYFSPELVEHIISEASESQIVKDQLKDRSRNIFTGKPFDTKANSANPFDMSSLFSIDEQKLVSSFSVDESKISLDFSGINKTLSQASLPPMDLEKLVGQLDMTLNQKDIETLIQDLMKGYEEYTKKNPQTDISNFPKYFQGYMEHEGSAKLKDSIYKALLENQGKPLTQVQIQTIITELLDGYNDYAKENNLPDIKKFSEHFAGYLKSEQAKNAIEKSIKSFVQSNKLDTKISGLMDEYIKAQAQVIGSTLEKELSSSTAQFADSMKNAISFDADTFASAIKFKMNEQELSELMASLMSKELYTYDTNLSKLGYADISSPSQISFYPKDFESKEKVVEIIDKYNEKMRKVDEDKVVRYTDLVGSMMSSVTTIINLITYVLIAFVAISLVVSSIMIGVITYISVLERKKEIGILRAIGASKRNISQVFNAETFIIGALSGIIGIGSTLLLLIPANFIIHTLSNNTSMSAALPPLGGIILILLSILLTLIGGIIPSRKAAKEDPVTALRTD